MPSTTTSALSLLASTLASTLALAQGPPPNGPPSGSTKATFAHVLKLNAYADNWCLIYINGKLAAIDQIEFLPHNVVSVNILPVYPMTIAVLAKDNADPNTGLEYGTQIGDAGFILKLADGTVTSAAWKVKTLFKGPLNRQIAHPRVEYTPVPANWFAADFDDSSWANATEYTAARVSPDGDFASYDFVNAKFIWSDDLDLDNTVLFRYTAPKPANYLKAWNADGNLDITHIASEARLASLTTPHLFEVTPNGLAAGYLTRIRNGQETTEPFAATVAGVTTALPIDLGPATDQLYLVLYGSNLPTATSASATATATIGGLIASIAYAGPLPSDNGMAQFNLAIPRALSGAATVEVTITVNGQSSNAVNVSVK